MFYPLAYAMGLSVLLAAGAAATPVEQYTQYLPAGTNPAMIGSGWAILSQSGNIRAADGAARQYPESGDGTCRPVTAGAGFPFLPPVWKPKDMLRALP